ncbi:MAG TPA: nucleotidyl transferase AbiEii/AbiGii toxin family protein [Thermodesulfovibrionales bacterium]|nr:nucleotidyl transferase AbiEii/AbiGii toxin family protein [Thermodesulfovibrionales bacterium]
MPAEYYNNVLYPLQDRAIRTFQDSPFYLTGGTTLSRGYYNHRYSDDLDYFVNYHSEFERLADLQVNRLYEIFPDVEIDYKGDFFYRAFAAERKLKIEMINDVPSHIGTLVKHPLLGTIDSKENILANKITAIVDRALPKDVVDIYFLLKDGLRLKQALLDAHSKAAGIAPLLIAKLFAEFDYSLLDEEIKWVTPVPGDTIRTFLVDIATAIVKGEL